MALRDEIQELINTQVAATRVGKLLLEEGEQAVLDADVHWQEILGALAAVFAAHRDGLMRLADEIDSLRN